MELGGELLRTLGERPGALNSDPKAPSASLEGVIHHAGRGSRGKHTKPAVSPNLLGAAFTAIHMGYLSRVAETQVLESAAEPSAWVSDLLATRAAAPIPYKVLVDMAGELAAAEPDDSPGPGDDAPTVRIAGADSEMRHGLATEAASECCARDPDCASGGADALDELKRCWMLGFFLRCCEQSAGRA